MTEDQHFMIEGAIEFCRSYEDSADGETMTFVFDQDQLITFLERVLNTGIARGRAAAKLEAET